MLANGRLLRIAADGRRAAIDVIAKRRPCAGYETTHGDDEADRHRRDNADQDRIFDHGRAVIVLAHARKETP